MSIYSHTDSDGDSIDVSASVHAGTVLVCVNDGGLVRVPVAGLIAALQDYPTSPEPYAAKSVEWASAPYAEALLTRIADTLDLLVEQGRPPVFNIITDPAIPAPVAEELFPVGTLVRVAWVRWSGVGRVTEVPGADGGGYLVDMLTGGHAGTEGGFDEHSLSPVEPLTDAPSVGDKLVVIDDGNGGKDIVGDVVTVSRVSWPNDFPDSIISYAERPGSGVYAHRFTRA